MIYSKKNLIVFEIESVRDKEKHHSLTSSSDQIEFYSKPSTEVYFIYKSSVDGFSGGPAKFVSKIK
jgi:hypothetical protein